MPVLIGDAALTRERLRMVTAGSCRKAGAGTAPHPRPLSSRRSVSARSKDAPGWRGVTGTGKLTYRAAPRPVVVGPAYGRQAPLSACSWGRGAGGWGQDTFLQGK